jgi:hypothetical protein
LAGAESSLRSRRSGQSGPGMNPIASWGAWQVGVEVEAGMAPWEDGDTAEGLVVAGAMESSEGAVVVAVAVAAGMERWEIAAGSAGASSGTIAETVARVAMAVTVALTVTVVLTESVVDGRGIAAGRNGAVAVVVEETVVGIGSRERT